ncbi:DUF397 domain-containing protein [Stackebrandtia sp.]|uniref:DUF397 domain-containing protein n=1 Tax=Stackebrandtia sp. TaxID=2023065 RepID=UPI0032C234F3
MTRSDVSRVQWRKSTRTGAGSGTGGNCVEVAAFTRRKGGSDGEAARIAMR